jgi:prepilin signal peptidase PulO-like enzyme (type II secretory pathway)
MAIVGCIAGFALDEAIARLAREPYERGELEDDDLRLKKDGGASLEFNSETGALAMPRALTTGSHIRRLVVVAATVVLFALAGRQYGDEALHVAIVAAYIAVLVVCTGTDALAYRVPNVITYPAILGALVVGLLMPDANPANVLVGGLLTGGTFFAMAVATRGGMGMGDVKLAFFVGFALGLSLGVQALLITAIAGGLIAVVLLVTRIRDRRDPIPYAPFIAGGMLFVMLLRGTAFIQL